MKKRLEIPVANLQYRFDETTLDAGTFDKLEASVGIIGQERALSAVRLGLEMKSKGYNIFVTGRPGTGRTTAIKLMLDKSISADEVPELFDICFVNNFVMAECPIALKFPAGEGRKFKKRIGYLLESLVKVIPKIFSGENYKDRRRRIIKAFESRQQELVKKFESNLAEKGFRLVQIQHGQGVRPDIVPIVNGQPISFTDLEKLVTENKFPKEDFEKLKNEYESLTREMRETSEEGKDISADLEEELDRLNSSLVLPLVNDKIDTLIGLYEHPKVIEYLQNVNEVLVEIIEVFQSGNGQQTEMLNPAQMRELLSQFAVNLLVDNSDQKTRPVVIEDFTSYKNLFGSIEMVHDPSSGLQSDFTRIRSGSILNANGGYLVLHAEDMFRDPHIWSALKKTLRSGRLTISNIDTFNRPGSGIKPESIEIDVKVILIGQNLTYNALYEMDDEFKKVFKIKAEFDSVMSNSDEGISEYARFVKKITADEKLTPLDCTGFAAIAEYGVKLSSRKDRLSTWFAKIADLIRESDWMARENKRDTISRETVKKTLSMQKDRVNLTETKIQEMYEQGNYLIDVTGWKTGQINGLSVYDLGDHSFGRPTRITVSLSPGAGGVINIEREAALSGRIHDKGVLILSGFMRNRFGTKRPLVFTASICFEQSYSGIDGDSASSTEIYALLSALSGKPINQALAVTGSVNQKGEVQPIGGVNDKIEGYFDVCMIDGLTGEQGVLIPKQNEKDLMLKDEVLQAVEDGKFHVYSIAHVDEGIEVLTGVAAGDADENGNFAEGGINDLTDNKLAELALIWQQYINRLSD